ncbi:hypothetical protein V2J09_004273 [Rumex salicifolius]
MKQRTAAPRRTHRPRTSRHHGSSWPTPAAGCYCAATVLSHTDQTSAVRPPSRTTQKNPLTALHIFNEIKSKHPNYRHNGGVYATMISILQSSGRISEMKEVINQMKRDSCEFKDKVAASVIKAFADAGMVDEAVSLFRSLPEFNCVNWTASFNTLLEILMKESKLVSFHRLFVDNSLGWEVKSRIGSLNLLMDSLCRIHRSDLALEVFQELSLQHCYPDRKSYMILMRGLCKDGRLNEAIHLLYSMFWRISHKGSGGDIAIYRTLLDTLCDHRQADETVEILGKVLRKGLRAPKSRRKLPDLDYIFANDDPKWAKSLIHEALIKCTLPSTASYGAVITDLYSEGKIKEANKVLDVMREKGFDASPKIYEEKVAALCREGLVEEAAKVIEEEMLQWNCVPTTEVFNAAVKGLCQKGSSITAVKLLEKMVKQPGCAPNQETYGLIVDGLCHDGMIDEASKILDIMVNNLHRPGSSTLDAVIRGFCSKGRIYDVVLWLEEMISHGLLPEQSLWDAMVGLFRHNMVETGAQLESIILSSSEGV